MKPYNEPSKVPFSATFVVLIPNLNDLDRQVGLSGRVRQDSHASMLTISLSGLKSSLGYPL